MTGPVDLFWLSESDFSVKTWMKDLFYFLLIDGRLRASQSFD